MGLYADHVLPRIVNAACGMQAAVPHRQATCSGLHGRVLELGFGSGLNVPHYPPAVTGVDAIEPADTAWEMAQERLDASDVPVQRSGLDGQRIPLPDDSCDTALSTWTMCTIPDLGTALQEVRRVMKPGGSLHFLEHGLAPDASVRRWQHRMEPLQKRLFGGCHLTRPIASLVTDAGFTLSEVDEFYQQGTPKLFGAETLGVAVSPR